MIWERNGWPFLPEGAAMVFASAEADQEIERRVAQRTRELKRLLDEKTTLLKEVHHRVKNNLQIVSSLLSMQIASGASDLVTGPLEDANSRVLAMSLIHECIYQSETLGEVDFAGYIEALAERLFTAYCVDPARIHLETALEPIPIALDQAIPCGLILNELISNALKHAFPDGHEGRLRISLRRAGGNRVALAIADNGIGLASGFRWQDSRSLGLQVVHTLIGQLHADLDVTCEGGTRYCFSWKLA
jgi:two-component sensor histidine kinase